jgi:hypothetical protein
MKALNRHVERVFSPDRKETHWGKRKLKRDQCAHRQRTRRALIMPHAALVLTVKALCAIKKTSVVPVTLKR